MRAKLGAHGCRRKPVSSAFTRSGTSSATQWLASAMRSMRISATQRPSPYVLRSESAWSRLPQMRSVGCSMRRVPGAGRRAAAR